MPTFGGYSVSLLLMTFETQRFGQAVISTGLTGICLKRSEQFEIRLCSTPETLATLDALADWRRSWSRTSELPTDPATAILSTERSRRQRRLTLLQESSDRGIALETDCDFVRVTGFAVCTCLAQQLRACRPVGLVFGEPHISG